MTNDEAFLSEIKLLSASQREGDFIAMLVDQHPDSFITVAQSFCEARRNGLSSELVELAQAGTIESMFKNNQFLEETSLEAIRLDDELATKYYCPEFAEGN